MTGSAITVDTGRVVASLKTLAGFGANGRGVCRPALSVDDMAARRWLAGQMTDAGLDVVIDAVGNVYGSTPGVARSVLIGSHSDSVPTGGWLDGALGVIYGIETARAWRAAHPDSPIGIDVVSFSDEEGRYLSCLGSRAFCGVLDDEALAASLVDGRSFFDVAREAGLDGLPRARLDRARHLAYFEAHIEQGPKLDGLGLDIGVVTGIAGMKRMQVRFDGRADHAGTTPMAMRRDAGMAAFDFAVQCEAQLRSVAAADSVWNFGAISFFPGVANVVPKLAELTVELRDLSADVMSAMMESVLMLARRLDGHRGVGVSAHVTGSLAPANMDGGLQQALSEQAELIGAATMALPSGAIHDAMLLAREIPSAMLFVPSIDGRSHTPVEDTSVRHIATGAMVFARAVEASALRLAAGATSV